MTKKLIFVFSLGLMFASCKVEDANKCTFKDSTLSASTEERTFLQNYFLLNSITASELSSGVFYNITRVGSGSTPNICSQVVVKYSGFLLGGTTAFDSYTTDGGRPFSLGSLIVGWQKGLAAIKVGGAITLYIPPSLGYGSSDVRDGNGNVVIPGNSYLKFDIELIDVR